MWHGEDDRMPVPEEGTPVDKETLLLLVGGNTSQLDCVASVRVFQLTAEELRRVRISNVLRNMYDDMSE